MHDFEILIYLLIWSALLWVIFTAIKTGAVEKILEDFVNDIDPDVQRVTRCEKCKYYDPEEYMCCAHWDYEEDEGFRCTMAPLDYCALAREKEKDD